MVRTMLVTPTICLVITGCGTQPNAGIQAPTIDETQESPSPAANKSGTIRFFDISNIDIRDVPMLMALDTLEAQGYTVETNYLSNSALIAEALARAEADIGLLNNQTMWQAIDQGADVRTIAQSVGSTTVFAARQDIESCRQLEDRPVGLANTKGASPALLDLYFQDNCPGIVPQFLVIPESAGRVAALLAGELDASLMPSEELLKLQQSAPDRFRALAIMAQEFPQVSIDGLHVRRDWAEEQPEMVKDFLRALLNANRQVTENPQVLYAESEKRLSLDFATVKPVADAHLQAGIWDANGGLTTENVQQTIDFLTGIDALPAGLTVNGVADLSYLEAVLDEIGRR